MRNDSAPCRHHVKNPYIDSYKYKFQDKSTIVLAYSSNNNVNDDDDDDGGYGDDDDDDNDDESNDVKDGNQDNCK